MNIQQKYYVNFLSYEMSQKGPRRNFLGSKLLTKTLFRIMIMMLLKLACADHKPNYRAVPQNIVDNICALLGTFA
jgi:hypothetical protein